MHIDLDLRLLRDDEFGAWSHGGTEEFARDIAENGDTPREIADRHAVEEGRRSVRWLAAAREGVVTAVR